jgi:hypothetical protein
MMEKFSAICVALCILSGCAGLSHAMQYNDVAVIAFDHAGHGWRIFDKPGEGRLMITPSIGRAAGVGAATGATFGLANTQIRREEFQGAAEAWLASTQRRCTVTEGALVIEPQWEFMYTCV